MNIDLSKMACFGVAGNFTGHLEQAGEDKDFRNIQTAEKNAPKALFPTYIPDAHNTHGVVPDFLGIYPFDDKTIYYPAEEDKLQIEPECGIVFDVIYDGNKVLDLKSVCFGASNDCSIRKEGAKKISLKKNWGKCSKGFSSQQIILNSFDKSSVIDDYRIASFMMRDNNLYEYGEDSAIRTYSFVYDKLVTWIIDRLNNQQDSGPGENLSSYLAAIGKVNQIFVSIGATRYTDFGECNYLAAGDQSIVVLYPESKYTIEDIKNILLMGNSRDDISILRQTVEQ